MKGLAIGLAIGLAAASVPTAAAITESFENPAYNPNAIVYGPDQSPFYGTNPGGPSATVAGFSFGGFSGILVNNNPASTLPATPYGQQKAFLQGYSGNGSQIIWSLSGLTPGNPYQLSFAAIGSAVIPAEAFDVVAFGGAPVSFTPGSSYANYSVFFTPTTAAGTISFTGAVVAGNAVSAIDNLSVSSVPEPSSWALLISGFGLAGGAARYRRRVVAA